MTMRYEPEERRCRVFAPKDCCRLLLLLRQNQRYFARLLDSLTIAWHGKSSGELQFSDDLKSD
jgi:hypothetical protein